jgi:hypothetical protein
MLVMGKGQDEWLRPVLGEHEAAATNRDGVFTRGDHLVRPGVRLGQILRGRPPGITAHQWSTAIRVHLAYVACDPLTYAPVLAAQLREPVPGASRDDRMTDAVCAAVGLPLLRIESSALASPRHGRHVMEYLLDALAFTEATGPGYRDLLGRLPDGRTGFVNDISAVARAAAIDAYASRQLADPTIRGLHVSWADGCAEGWAWLDVTDGDCVFERVRVWQYRFECGVEPARLAEDLAAAAIGERLKALDATPLPLRGKDDIAREFDGLRLRRQEMRGEFRYDHLTFG